MTTTTTTTTPPRGLLFDLDGTLLDTEPLSGRAIAMVTGPLGGALAESDPLRKQLLGRPSAEWTRLVITGLGLEGRLAPEALAHAWEANMAALMDEVDEMPGATATLRRLHARGIPMALATSSSRAAVAVKRARHEELFSYFSVIVCGDDPAVARGKPAPDIFLVAAARLLGGPDVDPTGCVVFEDSVHGITAARAAGMTAIALPDARYYPTPEERAELFAAAHERLPGLEAFDPAKYGL